MGTQETQVLLGRGSPSCNCKRAKGQSCLYCGTGGGPRKTGVLHWNLLLLCDFLLVDEVNLEIKKSAKREVNKGKSNLNIEKENLTAVGMKE